VEISRALARRLKAIDGATCCGGGGPNVGWELSISGPQISLQPAKDAP
jgi:hypothetical protein